MPPGVPVLPAAYHDAGGPAVAIGVEAADLAVQAFADAPFSGDARRRLIDLIETGARRVAEAVGRSCRRRIASEEWISRSRRSPDAAHSIGTAFEALSGSRAGERGTLAAVAFIADTLDRAQFARTGYSGIFLPVLEDAVLAARAADGCLTVSDLLLWSSVCGTGLDTVPLPGDITVEALAAVLLDVAALALRLDKPLSARLMPMPGKRAGDAVTFDFPFFAPSRVLARRNARASEGCSRSLTRSTCARADWCSSQFSVPGSQGITRDTRWRERVAGRRPSVADAGR